MSEAPTTYTAATAAVAPAQRRPARRPSGQNLSERGRLEAQRRFLDELETTANVAGACRAARVSRTIAYEWRTQDRVFAAAWQGALDSALDDLEQIAFQRAREGSDQLVMFLLRAHRPQKYRDVVTHEASGETILRVIFTNDWRGARRHDLDEHDEHDEHDDSSGASAGAATTSGDHEDVGLDFVESVGKMLGRAVVRNATSVHTS